MTPAEAKHQVEGYASANRIKYTLHALRRMRQRNIQDEDVYNALTHVTRCVEQPGSRWRVEGPDMDGDSLAVIVSFEDGVLIVTLF